jgi:hypothetical protein
LPINVRQFAPLLLDKKPLNGLRVKTWTKRD